jgi:hypothetical protein
MSYYLFLDDVRMPVEVGNYITPVVLRATYRLGEWIIVRSYTEFIDAILERGLPDLVSFDHDLADGHYHKNMQEGILDYNAPDFEDDDHKTGYHCAQWLIEYCKKMDKPLPSYLVHSMNPVGAENIKHALSTHLAIFKKKSYGQE